MSNYSAQYSSKLTTAEEAVKVVKSGDWVDYTMAHGMPVKLDEALAARKGELKDIKVRGCLTLRPRQVVETDPEKETFTYMNWHFSGYDRKLCDRGLCYYIPLLYRNKPFHYEKYLDVDVAMVSVTPMDKHGNFGFSLNNSATRAILNKAKIVIVEINEKLPKCHGLHDDTIHISQVDYIVEGDNPELPTLPAGEPGEVEIKIANHIVEEIPNNAVLQLGIGGIPNAIGKILAGSDIKGLGMHTEMLVDAYLELDKAGKLDNSIKRVDRGKGVWSFSIGGSELYEWVDDNPSLGSAPVNYTNDPYVIGRMENFISVNACLEVDLYGQVAAEASATRQISGTGGQLDFVTGAYMSNGGKGFVCLPSTFTDKNGKLQSRINPMLPQGSTVTDPRNQAFYIVTEFGKVNLAGCSNWERAERLISIAHPDFRDELIEGAKKIGVFR